MSMAVETPDIDHPKLPLWRSISLSYSTYFRDFPDVLRASWLWLVLVAVLTGFANWLQWSWMATVLANVKSGVPPQISRPIEMTVLSNAAGLAVMIAGVSIAVAWHRRILLDERPGFSGSNIVTRALWRYVGAGLAIFLISIGPAMLIALPVLLLVAPAGTPIAPQQGAQFPLLMLLIVALYVAGFAAMLRLSMLLPARAIGNAGLTFEQAWNRSRGNIWRIFWGIVACTLPPVMAVQIVVLLAIGFPTDAMFASDGFVTRMAVSGTIFLAYYVLITPIGIGFLSHAYRHFFPRPGS
jgi:hypothetical protein